MYVGPAADLCRWRPTRGRLDHRLEHGLLVGRDARRRSADARQSHLKEREEMAGRLETGLRHLFGAADARQSHLRVKDRLPLELPPLPGSDKRVPE